MRERCWSSWSRYGIILSLLCGCAHSGRGGELISFDNPNQFFTNVASRLLKSELGLEVTHIQLYPTNQYTPAVHRLLQLTANLYDAGKSRAGEEYPFVPSVFRPVISREVGVKANSIFISGFEHVTNAPALLDPTVIWRSLSELSDPGSAPPNDDEMVYGVPWIIGARKGFPNFNEFLMQTAITVSRGLEFRRATNHGKVTETNVMHTFAVSNVFAMEAWNSYSNTYPRALRMSAAVEVQCIVTNEFGVMLASNLFSSVHAPDRIIPRGTWPCWLNPNYASSSFVSPLNEPFISVSNSIYRAQVRIFVTATPDVPFEQLPPGLTFEPPRWFVCLRTRVRYELVDTELNSIVDFVNLEKHEMPVDVNGALARDGTCKLNDASDGSMWCTNRPNWSNDNEAPTVGLLNQIAVCLEAVRPISWDDFEIRVPAGLDVEGGIDFFRAQYGFAPHYYQGSAFPKTNLFYAPLQARRTIFLDTAFEANDPLVHYTVADLSDYYGSFLSNRVHFYNPWSPNGIGAINRRYEPWGGNPIYDSRSPTKTDLGVKDSMVMRSDDWDFPIEAELTVANIGRVHRGTPWQTVNLKSVSPPILPAGLFYWSRWSGHSYMLGVETHPYRDWQVVSLLAPLFDPVDPHERPSANEVNVARLRQLLDGVTVYMMVDPANVHRLVLTSGMSDVETIATALVVRRQSLPGKQFQYLGEMLVTPELSVAPPWPNFTNYGVRLQDWQIEALPAVMMSRLRGDSCALVRSQTRQELTIRFTGIEGKQYRVECSEDASKWFPIMTNNVMAGGFDFAVGLDPRLRGLFYRSVLQ